LYSKCNISFKQYSNMLLIPGNYKIKNLYTLADKCFGLCRIPFSDLVRKKYTLEFSAYLNNERSNLSLNLSHLFIQSKAILKFLLCLELKGKSKSKVIPLQAYGAQRVLRGQVYQIPWHRHLKVVGCQPYAPAVFTSRSILVLIFRDWVDPGHMELSDGVLNEYVYN
jgi:hypothetical protein